MKKITTFYLVLLFVLNANGFDRKFIDSNKRNVFSISYFAKDQSISIYQNRKNKGTILVEQKSLNDKVVSLVRNGKISFIHAQSKQNEFIYELKVQYSQGLPIAALGIKLRSPRYFQDNASKTCNSFKPSAGKAVFDLTQVYSNSKTENINFFSNESVCAQSLKQLPTSSDPNTLFKKTILPLENFLNECDLDNDSTELGFLSGKVRVLTEQIISGATPLEVECNSSIPECGRFEPPRKLTFNFLCDSQISPSEVIRKELLRYCVDNEKVNGEFLEKLSKLQCPQKGSEYVLVESLKSFEISAQEKAVRDGSVSIQLPNSVGQTLNSESFVSGVYNQIQFAADSPIPISVSGDFSRSALPLSNFLSGWAKTAATLPNAFANQKAYISSNRKPSDPRNDHRKPASFVGKLETIPGPSPSRNIIDDERSNASRSEFLTREVGPPHVKADILRANPSPTPSTKTNSPQPGKGGENVNTTSSATPTQGFAGAPGPASTNRDPRNSSTTTKKGSGFETDWGGDQALITYRKIVNDPKFKKEYSDRVAVSGAMLFLPGNSSPIGVDKPKPGITLYQVRVFGDPKAPSKVQLIRMTN